MKVDGEKEINDALCAHCVHHLRMKSRSLSYFKIKSMLKLKKNMMMKKNLYTDSITAEDLKFQVFHAGLIICTLNCYDRNANERIESF